MLSFLEQLEVKSEQLLETIFHHDSLYFYYCMEDCIEDSNRNRTENCTVNCTEDYSEHCTEDCIEIGTEDCSEVCFENDSEYCSESKEGIVYDSFSKCFCRNSARVL